MNTLVFPLLGGIALRHVYTGLQSPAGGIKSQLPTAVTGAPVYCALASLTQFPPCPLEFPSLPKKTACAWILAGGIQTKATNSRAFPRSGFEALEFLGKQARERTFACVTRFPPFGCNNMEDQVRLERFHLWHHMCHHLALSGIPSPHPSPAIVGRMFGAQNHA